VHGLDRPFDIDNGSGHDRSGTPVRIDARFVVGLE